MKKILHLSRLNYEISEALKRETASSKAEVRFIGLKNFRIKFEGNVGRSGTSIKMWKVNFMVWTTEAEEFLQNLRNQLFKTLKRTEQFFENRQQKRPKLKFWGYIDKDGLSVDTSLGKTSCSLTESTAS